MRSSWFLTSFGGFSLGRRVWRLRPNSNSLPDLEHGISLYLHNEEKRPMRINRTRAVTMLGMVIILGCVMSSVAGLSVNDELLEAAEKGSLEQVTTLVEKGADVNTKRSYRTAVMAAAQSGNLDLVKFLVEKGADPQVKSRLGNTAVMSAVRSGNLEVVKFLTGKGVGVNAEDEKGRTALMFAARAGKLGIVEFLVDRGANVNAKDRIDQTVLMCATGGKLINFDETAVKPDGRGKSANLEVVKFLIDKGADVNARGPGSRTATMLAAEAGDPEIVKLLLGMGADVNAEAEYYYTTLMFGAGSGNLAVVKLLVDKGANVNAVDLTGRTALLEAAGAGNLEVAQLLINKGANVKAKTKGAQTLLMAAAASGKLQMVKFLTDKGLDVNATNPSGFTVLMSAADGGNPEVARFLIDRGAAVNTKAKDGQTALIRAADRGNLEVVKVLVDKGAGLNVKDEHGWTALLSAAKSRKCEVVKLLAEKGADVNAAESHDGLTALMYAVTLLSSGNVEVVKVLIDKGADMNAKNNYGDTALKMAENAGYIQIAELMKNQGALEERKFFGKIGAYSVSMRLGVSKKGYVKGVYSYDAHKKEIPFSGKIDGGAVALKVYNEAGVVLETFDGSYTTKFTDRITGAPQPIDDAIDGIWKGKGKALEFHLAREPWDDHYVSCEEMQKYPEKVFAERSVYLGSGAISPNVVDYKCEGGLLSLGFLEKLYTLSDSIRSQGPQGTCSGSSMHMYRRSFLYELLEAGLAPDMYALHREQWEKDAQVYRKYENALHYFRLWAHQSLYNFELYNVFWEEYNHVRPALIKHYEERFKAPHEKAIGYADKGLGCFVIWAAGSYEYDLQGGEPRITPIEEAIASPDTTQKNLADIIEQTASQDELDQALRVALLHQRPQSVLELLLTKGARINTDDESALFFALRNRDHVKFLLARGADVNYENGFGKTVLFYAIGFKDIEMVRLLLDHKADVNHSYKGKEAMTEIENEGNVPFYQSYCALAHGKRTPLMHAAQHGNVELIKLLLQRGAKLDSVDEEGFNAADYADMGNKPENWQYLNGLGLKGKMAGQS